MLIWKRKKSPKLPSKSPLDTAPIFKWSPSFAQIILCHWRVCSVNYSGEASQRADSWCAASSMGIWGWKSGHVLFKGNRVDCDFFWTISALVAIRVWFSWPWAFCLLFGWSVACLGWFLAFVLDYHIGVHSTGCRLTSMSSAIKHDTHK